MRFAVITLGCKVNQCESNSAAKLLSRSGLVPASRAEAAGDPNRDQSRLDAAVKSRQAIRRAARRHPQADILILGCLATEQGQALRQVAVEAGSAGRIRVAGHADDPAQALARVVASLPRRRVGGLRPTRRQAHPLAHGSASPGGITHRAEYLGRGGASTTPARPCGDEGWIRGGKSHHPAGVAPIPVSASSGIRTSPPPGVKQNEAGAARSQSGGAVRPRG